MPNDINSDNISDSQQEETPPSGDNEKAEKYLNQLVDLINQDKLKVIHTDLKKFDIESIQDHYHLDLEDYEVEINHSKEPNSGQDFYVLLFNNLKKIREGGDSCVNKVILAYTHLTQNQFQNFKTAADEAIDRERQRKDAKKFAEAMVPIDDILVKIKNSPAEETLTEDSEKDLANFEETKPQEENQNLDQGPKASDFPTFQSQSGF